MWPFSPRERRQVYESGGSDGSQQGSDGGGYSTEQGQGYSGDTGYGATDVSGGSGIGSTGGGWGSTGGGWTDPVSGNTYAAGDTPGTAVSGPAAETGTSGATAPSGEAPAPSGETGTPAGVAPAGSAPQPGLDTPDPGLGDIGAYVDTGTGVTREGALAAPSGYENPQGYSYSGTLAPGYSPDFGNIVDQFGPSLSSDPFATSDDERGTPTSGFSLPDRTDQGETISSTVSQVPSRDTLSLNTGGTSLGPMSPDLAGAAVPEVGSTPGSATTSGPSAGGTPGSTPGSQPDVSAGGPAGGSYTDAERAASAPSTEQFSPAPNIGTAIMQAIFGLGGATIGGPVAGFLNQNLATTVGGIPVPGVSTAAGLLGNAQTLGNLTGLVSGRAGSPSERAQPNIASMLWDMVNGRASTSRGLSPIGFATRTTIPGYVFGRDDRTEPGAPPPATDPRTYDRGALRGVSTDLPGLPPNPTLQQLREALMVPQDMSITDPNQAGDNRVEDMLLAALGLDPTGQDTPTTGPTEGQLPSTFPGYFAGGESNLNPVIQGQRTAFDPRFFV